LVIAYFAAAAAPRQGEPSAKPSFGALLGAVATPSFLALLGPVLLQLVGSGLSYASMLYFVIYNLGRADGFAMLGVLVLIMTAGIVLGQPIWLALSKRIGKHPTYLIATAGYGLSLGAWALLNASSPIAASYLAAASLAVFNSGWALASYSMLGDIIAEDAAHNGRDRGGVFSSLWIAADKIGFALGGTLLVGLLLSAFNFDSAKAVIGAPQAESAQLGIAIAFGFAPFALNGLAFVWFLLANPAVRGRARQGS
jgi:Na+/melibiose symporter-like transporter